MSEEIHLTEKKYTYHYPRPAVTVDAILVKHKNNKIEVLLIKRKNEPFKDSWAFPGGFVDQNEDLEDACKRELIEETGISVNSLRQFKTVGTPHRDPRGHTISILFWNLVDASTQAICGDDAAEACWFSIDELPPLAFDHSAIINDFKSIIIEKMG